MPAIGAIANGDGRLTDPIFMMTTINAEIAELAEPTLCCAFCG
jgi:hypothetical protein